MRQYITCLCLMTVIGFVLIGCGDQATNTPISQIVAESTQEVDGRATGNRLTLITKIRDTRWYYAVMYYRGGAQRIVPVELESDRAVVVVTGYQGEAELGQLKTVKVFSRPLSDISYNSPPFRYQPLDGKPCRSLVLVHGYLGTEISLRTMRQTLRGMYDHVFMYAYEYNDYITGNAARFASWMNDLAITGQGKRCDIVAHSLGGLVAREAIENRGLSTYVDNLVTLGTPHQGDSWAATPVLAPLTSLLLDQGSWMSGNYFESLYRYFFNATGHMSVLADLNPTSPFIEQLNRPSHTSCTYITIAGELPEWGGDLAVTARNANWSGLAEEAAHHQTATLALGHSQLLSHRLAVSTVKELLLANR